MNSNSRRQNLYSNSNRSPSQQIDWDSKIARLRCLKGVVGVCILSRHDGSIVKCSSLDNSTINVFRNLCLSTLQNVESLVKDLDTSNNVNFVRITTTRQELIVGVEDSHYILVVQQQHS
ncbi:MAG: Dynein light chain roadblock-type 2 [Marteilia pararefringens]